MSAAVSAVFMFMLFCGDIFLRCGWTPAATHGRVWRRRITRSGGPLVLPGQQAVAGAVPKIKAVIDVRPAGHLQLIEALG